MTYKCDVCDKAISKKSCRNVFFGESGKAMLITSTPLPDPKGGIITRYHEECYPKNLVERLNKCRSVPCMVR